MFFLNLTAGEFFVLLGALAGLITALYLLDRMKRKRVVSTLRFWGPAFSADVRQSRRRMRDPWSLVLQLAGMLLLLLAIAQLQWGVRQRRGRDHVLLLDTSAWTAERAREGTLLDREKDRARQYLTGMGLTDRVMVVRADSLATPAVAFTEDHARLEQAVDESASSFSALNLEQALAFASEAQAGSPGPGEIVYIGPGLVESTSQVSERIPNLRVIQVNANQANCGIRHIGARANEGESSGSWDAAITLKNYGASARRVRLHVQFAGTAFAPRNVELAPGREETAEYTFETNTAGVLAIDMEPHDDLPQDDHAEIWLPGNRALKLAVFTARPDVLKPLLEADSHLSVSVASPSEYNPKPRADIMLVDGISVPSPPQIPCLWIAPPPASSPLKVRAVIDNASIRSWDSASLLGAALYTKETRLPAAQVFETGAHDLIIGSVDKGPVVVASPATRNRPKLAIIGFDPLSTDLRFQVTTPLLFAGLMRWLSPEAFQPEDVIADHVGAATVNLDPGERINGIRVKDEAGSDIPFTARNHTVQLFTARPGIVNLASENRHRILSLTLPEIADVKWVFPATVAEGLPSAAGVLPSAIDLWKWLAVLGAVILAFEWVLYGGHRRANKVRRHPKTPASEHDRFQEPVSK